MIGKLGCLSNVLGDVTLRYGDPRRSVTCLDRVTLMQFYQVPRMS